MPDDSRLLALALGTFHTALLTLLLVLLLYLTVDLGEALAGLDTAAGLAIFGALWATSVYCAHRAVRDAGLQSGSVAPAGSVLRQGMTWGAWNGVLFFWCLLAAGLVLLIATAIAEGGGVTSSSSSGFVTSRGEVIERVVREDRDGLAGAIAGVLVFGVVAFGVGTVLAPGIGAGVGVVFAMLDIGLLRASRLLVPAGSMDKDRDG